MQTHRTARKNVTIGAVALLAGLLLACGGTSAVRQQPTQAATTNGSDAPSSTAAATALAVQATAAPAGPLTPAQIVERLTPSTVLIRAAFPSTVYSEEGLGSGTGIVFKADDNKIYVLTNAHVVEGAATIELAPSGEKQLRPARIVASSTCDDLAVLSVDNTDGLVPATFGSQVASGDRVVALGFPLSFDLGGQMTVTQGIISNPKQQLDTYEHLIQTDAAINPGNSGGPLVNEQGEVIGINTLGINSTQGINFAINGDYGLTTAERLTAGKSLLWLGMNLRSVQTDGAGVVLVVDAVGSGSPAARAGVVPGDILSGVENVTVESKADVCKILRSHADGDVLRLSIGRLTDTEVQAWAGEVAIGDPANVQALQMTASQPRSGTQANGNTQTGQDTQTEQTNVVQLQYDFANKPENAFAIGDEEQVRAEFYEGSYMLSLKEPNLSFTSPALEAPVGTDMSLVANVFPGESSEAGISLRYTQGEQGAHDAYVCVISNEATYSCYVLKGGKDTTLVDRTPSSAIKANDSNTLGMSVIGNEIVFSVNGTELVRTQDNTLVSGVPGLFVQSVSSPASATYNNVTISVAESK